MPNPTSPHPGHDAFGPWALLLGCVAAVLVAIPVVGDVFALPPGIAALVVGLIGVTRFEQGRSPRVALSLAGAIVGAVVVLICGVMIAVAGAH